MERMNRAMPNIGKGAEAKPPGAGAALKVLRDEMDTRMAWHLGAATAMVVLAGLLAALAPLALKGMVDAVTRADAAPRAAALFGALYLALLTAGRLVTELRLPLFGNAEQHFYARLQRRFLDHVLRLNLSFHLQSRTGALMQTLQQAVLGYQIVLFSLLGSVVPVAVELATVAVVLTTLDQVALLASFAVTAVAYLLVLKVSAPRIQANAGAVSAQALRTNGLLVDSLLNVETLKCFVAEPMAGRRLADLTRELERSWQRLYRQRTWMGIAMAVTFSLSVCASLAISIHAVGTGTLSVGGFVLANLYILQVMRPLEMLGSALRDLAQALGFIRPMLDVLDEPEGDPPFGRENLAPNKPQPNTAPPDRHTLDWPTPSRPTPNRPPHLTFRNVGFAHGDDGHVLKDFSLHVPAGTSLGIVGRSGSGKSSLARLLLRLYRPHTGQILLDGKPIEDLDVRELRAMIGFVAQDTALLDDTLASNIGIGCPEATAREIEYAARAAHLHDFILSLPQGYDTQVGERGLRLSGGERQRVAIARTVLKRPLLYVLDEATSMLDGLTEAAILRDLHDVSEGCTTITIAHRLATVQRCDQIAVLDAGTVVELGRHEDLLGRGGPYARLWSTQG
jgi:ABC-type multidrug transport system fused ATPase/permease subunit